MANIVRKEFYTDCTWTAPAGVGSVNVYGVKVDPLVQPMLNNYTSQSNFFSIMLDSECCLYTWGAGTCGILGDNTITSKCVPVPVCGGVRFTKFVHSDCAVAAFDVSNAVYMWGTNECGKLGDGTNTPRCCPVPVCGGLRFKEISINAFNTIGVTLDGCAYAWGSNCSGQLGDGTTTVRCCPVPVCGGLRFKSINAINGGHIGITPEGCAYAWGANDYGQLGDGTITFRCCPVPVCGGLRFKKITTGYFGTITGLTVDNCVYTWGYSSGGVLGDGANSNKCCPTRICGNLGFIDVCTFSFTSYGITPEGCLYAWGTNFDGRVGDGTTTDRCCPVPVCGGLRFKSIPRLGMGLTNCGLVYVWGSNTDARLGDGTTTDRCCPVPLCTTLRFVSLGGFSYNNPLAIATNGYLYSWGFNVVGSVGDCTITNRCCPVRVCTNAIHINRTTPNFASVPVVPGQTYHISTSGNTYSFNGISVGSNNCALVLEYVL